MVRVDTSSLYDGTAKVALLDAYLENIRRLPLDGEEVVLTGEAPIWLYLKVAHALHGRAKRLWYESPALGKNNRILIFDHDPF